MTLHYLPTAQTKPAVLQICIKQEITLALLIQVVIIQLHSLQVCYYRLYYDDNYKLYVLVICMYIAALCIMIFEWLYCSTFPEYYYIEMLRDNITGTLGGQVCAYWRAAISYSIYGTWSQYSTQLVADNTEVVRMRDDFAVGESSDEMIEVVVAVAPYLFRYCEEYAENENYKIVFGKELGHEFY